MKSRGRKAQYIGVDLGGTNVRAGTVGGGRVIRVKAQPVRSRATDGEVFEDVCAVIDAVHLPGVRGIGIGVPSLVDVKRGEVISTVNIPAWTGIPLRRRLEKKYRIPVRIENDANCFALGERRYGRGRNCDNFVGLIIGTGLGAGIISNGRLHSGVDCGAGEFGMIPYGESILEHYASGQFFQRQSRDGEELARAAAFGDSGARELFRQYGHHLAHGIKLILYGLAPEKIILGGSVSMSYCFFKEAVDAGLKEFGYPSIARKLRIEISKLKGAALLGAASLFDEDV